MSSVKIKASFDAASSSSEAGSSSQLGSNAGEVQHDRLRARHQAAARAKPILAAELDERVAQGRWDLQDGPLVSYSPEDESENEDEGEPEHDAMARAVATALARQKAQAKAGQKAGMWEAIVYSPDVVMGMTWLRLRLRPARTAWRMVQRPLSIAWISLVLHALTLLLTAVYTHSSNLRPEDGPVSATLGTLSFLCAMSSGAVGRVLRTTWGLDSDSQGLHKGSTAKQVKPLPNGLQVQEMAVLRSMRTAKAGEAIPILWLAVLVGTISTWTRAALVLGLTPLHSVLVVSVMAVDVLVDVMILRSYMSGFLVTVGAQLESSLPFASASVPDGRAGAAQGAGQGSAEGAQERDAEPPALSTLGLGKVDPELLPRRSAQMSKPSALPSSPQEARHPDRLTYEALTQGVPDRYKGIGRFSLMDRGVSLLCMLAGVTRALCPVLERYSPPDEAEISVGQGDPSFADTLFNLAREDHAARIGACRDMHAQWPTWALLALWLVYIVHIARKMYNPPLPPTALGPSPRYPRWTIYGAWRLEVFCPLLMPLAALAVMATTGLPLSPSMPASAFTQWGVQGSDMPGALYGTCDADADAPNLTALHATSLHASCILFLAALVASWCTFVLADSAFLAIALLHAGSIPAPSAVPSSLPLHPQAATGILLTALLICMGCAGMTAAATPAVAADALGPLPYFGVFLCVMAGGRHAVSALDGVEQLLDREYGRVQGKEKGK